jgi:preprotein translocase subunit SecG
MKNFLLFLQVAIGILLIAAILLQNKGTGLGGIFGGEGNVYRTRRGAERGLFILTIVMGALFLILGAFNFYHS